MGAWMLVQIILNLFFAAGLFIMFKKLSRAPKDDPRLSRGLQLLQSKIAILEDLADRTELQVKQLSMIMDQKSREVQAKIQAADKQIQAIESSMEKSMDVAKIFQDRIPHEEIIERQNTVKYIQAARLAHSGLSTDQIRQEIDLPTGELDFIVKINRSQLMFAEEDLPAWAQDAKEGKATAVTASAAAKNNSTVISQPTEPSPAASSTASGTSLTGASAANPVTTDKSANIGPVSPADNPELTLEQLGERFRRIHGQMTNPASKDSTQLSIRKVEFPRVDLK